MLQPSKCIFEDNQQILNYDQFKSLLENTFGVKDLIDIVENYTDNFPALINLMKLVYPLLQERCIKNRLHRLTKKIENSNDKSNVTEVSDNDMSYTSE